MVDMVEDEFPPVPTTALALAGRWLARDVLYEENVRMSLPESTVAVVRAQRQREAMSLRNPKERAKMWRKAQTWTQPKHSDFGSLRDWLDD
jgi:hypothetical protein